MTFINVSAKVFDYNKPILSDIIDRNVDTIAMHPLYTINPHWNTVCGTLNISNHFFRSVQTTTDLYL